MEKLLNEFSDFSSLDFREDIKSFIEFKGQQPSLDLYDLIHLKKSDMTALVSDKMEQLDEGWIDTVDLFIYAKKLEYVASELVKASKDKVEPGKWGVGFTKYDVELVGRNSAGSWDFSGCNYQPLESKKADAKLIAEDIKQYQEFLKGLKEPIELLIEDEIIKVFPPIKGGKLGPVATLK